MNRRRGRPRKPEGEVRVETVRGRVPADVFERLCQRATRERKSVSALVGDLLVLIFRRKEIQIRGDLS
jgi:hypothetical protein